MTREQLLGRGFSGEAIRHRLARGRLHRVRRGVYAVGSRRLDERGHWLAAVLYCGHGAMVSHWSALYAWGVDGRPPLDIQITIRDDVRLEPAGVVVHRRRSFPRSDRTELDGFPVTTALRALFDVAPGLRERRLERLIAEADRLELVRTDELPDAVATRKGQPGAGALRALLARWSFTRTDSELERRFLRLVRATALPTPETQAEVAGLRYHRTEAQQRDDRRRDRLLAAKGLTVLRFTHHEVFRQPRRVAEELERVATVLADAA